MNTVVKSPFFSILILMIYPAIKERVVVTDVYSFIPNLSINLSDIVPPHDITSATNAISKK